MEKLSNNKDLAQLQCEENQLHFVQSQQNITELIQGGHGTF